MEIRKMFILLVFSFAYNSGLTQNGINLYPNSLNENNFFYFEGDKSDLRIDFKKNKGDVVLSEFQFLNGNVEYEQRSKNDRLKCIKIKLNSLEESRVRLKLIDTKTNSYLVTIYLIKERVSVDNLVSKEIYFDSTQPFKLIYTVKDCCLDFVLKNKKIDFETSNYNVLIDRFYKIPRGKYELYINNQLFSFVKFR